MNVSLTRMSSHLPMLMLLVGLIATAGCGSHEVTTVPVEGRITLAGGDWPATGLITFAPKEPAAGYPRRAGQAIFQPNGSFRATTFSTGDGLIPGTYSVNIRCVSSTTQDISKGVNHVPAKYQRGESSGFEVVVPADDSETIKVEFNVPKS